MDMNSVINVVMQKLFEPEKRRLNGVIIDLNRSNKELKALKVDGFLYGGKLYMPSGVSTVALAANQAKSTLDVSLWNEMDRWVKDRKSIEDDVAMVRQMLFKLLKPCKTKREVRNALPECLVNLIQGLAANHPRHDTAGYTLEGDERSMRQFVKFLPKMELYSVMGLLY